MRKRSLDICTAHRGRADGSCSNTSDNALSVVARRQRSRGWGLGKRCHLWKLHWCTAVLWHNSHCWLFMCRQLYEWMEWNKHDDTQSKIIRYKCIALRRIMLSTKVGFCNHSSPQWREYTGNGSQHPLSDFQYLFAHRLMKGSALGVLSIFLLSQAKSEAIFLLIERAWMHLSRYVEINTLSFTAKVHLNHRPRCQKIYGNW